MRLFIATPLPGFVAEEVDAAVSRYRTTRAVSWVRAGAFHVTWAFVGEQPADVVPRIAAAVEARVSAIEEAEVRVGEAGAFPDARRARVLWMSLTSTDALSRIAAAVREGLGDAAVPFDDKPFRPHLTVGRVRERWSGCSAMVDALSGFESRPFRLDHVSVYSSVLGSGGAVHSVEAMLKLRERRITAGTR